MEIARPQTWRLTFSKLMKNFITDTFFHYGDCSSTWPKQARGRCCFSILRRAPNGHFYGLIRLEDERRYSVDIADCTRIYDPPTQSACLAHIYGIFSPHRQSRLSGARSKQSGLTMTCGVLPLVSSHPSGPVHGSRNSTRIAGE